VLRQTQAAYVAKQAHFIPKDATATGFQDTLLMITQQGIIKAILLKWWLRPGYFLDPDTLVHRY
jgi:hypothetical protein